jgi:hypothetical protein
VYEAVQKMAQFCAQLFAQENAASGWSHPARLHTVHSPCRGKKTLYIDTVSAGEVSKNTEKLDKINR